nr:hypothetical protein [Acidobacteriota bacterium]
MQMKIFADKRYLPERLPHCQMLFPFWGFTSKLARLTGLRFQVFDGYMERGAGLFAIAPLAEAEVAVLPFHWEQIVPQNLVSRCDVALYGEDMDVMRRTVTDALRRAEELAEEAAGAGKPLAVFFVDDSETITVPLRGAYTFRPSLSAARRAPREFAMPVWISEDKVETSFGGRLPLRRKAARPVVSFCGQPGPRPSGVRSKLR